MDRPERRVLWLPAEEIRPNPMQPRRTFEEAGLRELAESIRRHGILQPLTVRRTAAGWELVAGERRLRAARLAGLASVPCLETEVDSRASALLALVENLQRKDLHYLEEAAAIAAFRRAVSRSPSSSSRSRHRAWRSVRPCSTSSARQAGDSRSSRSLLASADGDIPSWAATAS